MGLGGELLRRGISVMIKALELGYEIFDHPPTTLPTAVLDGECLVDEGPDDLWPGTEFVATSATAGPDLLVTRQWGLRLPNGEVCWGQWKGYHLDEPLDRVKLIANLNTVALDVGLSPGEQIEDFLSHYGWVTRDQLATVVYQDTGAYPLTHPEVSALGTPARGENNESRDGRQSTPGNDQSGEFHPGSVGGDAR